MRYALCGRKEILSELCVAFLKIRGICLLFSLTMSSGTAEPTSATAIATQACEQVNPTQSVKKVEIKDKKLNSIHHKDKSPIFHLYVEWHDERHTLVNIVQKETKIIDIQSFNGFVHIRTSSDLSDWAKKQIFNCSTKFFKGICKISKKLQIQENLPEGVVSLKRWKDADIVEITFFNGYWMANALKNFILINGRYRAVKCLVSGNKSSLKQKELKAESEIMNAYSDYSQFIAKVHLRQPKISATTRSYAMVVSKPKCQEVAATFSPPKTDTGISSKADSFDSKTSPANVEHSDSKTPLLQLNQKIQELEGILEIQDAELKLFKNLDSKLSILMDQVSTLSQNFETFKFRYQFPSASLGNPNIPFTPIQQPSKKRVKISSPSIAPIKPSESKVDDSKNKTIIDSNLEKIVELKVKSIPIDNKAEKIGIPCSSQEKNKTTVKNAIASVIKKFTTPKKSANQRSSSSSGLNENFVRSNQKGDTLSDLSVAVV
jgi:hypothetical protein